MRKKWNVVTLAALLTIGMLLSGCGLLSAFSKKGNSNEIYEDGYRYLKDETNQECILVGYSESECPKDVVIPATVSGYTVTTVRSAAFFGHTEIETVQFASPSGLKTIQDNAFYGCKGLTGIELPEGLEEIRWNAFYGCTGLKSVKIPSTLNLVGRRAFYGCSKLKDVIIQNVESWCGIRFELDNNLEYDSNPLMNGAHFVLDGKEVTKLTIPETVKEILSGTFCGLQSVETVELPDGLTRIGTCAFYNCPDLKTVNVPASVVSVGESAFGMCASLETVSFAEPVSSKDTKTIGANAFEDCTSLKTVVLPSNLVSIEESCFAYCSGLENITIPKSVKKIAKCALRNCKALKDIYYAGSSDDWDSIDKKTFKGGKENNWDYNAGKDEGIYTIHTDNEDIPVSVE